MSILERIVNDTRMLVRDKKSRVSSARLEREEAFNRKPLELAAALRAEGISIIGEIKKVSPSQGVLRQVYRPVDIAKSYVDAGAAAISVLTEPAHFQGSMEDLAAIRPNVTVPILRKDFVIDVYQLVEARAYGADAVLLIAAVLDRSLLHDLLQACTDLGLSALVEVHAFEELDRIDFDEVSVLGVNNRNLDTFEVDVDHSLRVFAEVPSDVVRVSESGLSNVDQLIHLSENGIDAVLIGESFMRSENPGEALSHLRKQIESEAAR